MVIPALAFISLTLWEHREDIGSIRAKKQSKGPLRMAGLKKCQAKTIGTISENTITQFNTNN
jgi:hypothetical protein